MILPGYQTLKICPHIGFVSALVDPRSRLARHQVWFRRELGKDFVEGMLMKLENKSSRFTLLAFSWSALGFTIPFGSFTPGLPLILPLCSCSREASIQGPDLRNCSMDEFIFPRPGRVPRLQVSCDIDSLIPKQCLHYPSCVQSTGFAWPASRRVSFEKEGFGLRCPAWITYFRRRSSSW